MALGSCDFVKFCPVTGSQIIAPASRLDGDFSNTIVQDLGCSFLHGVIDIANSACELESDQ